ncbi:MAG: GNAT family N-acetyltransferase [Candidatus Thorarchaeota archaeon]
MVEISQRKWDDLDITALANLTRSVYTFEGRGEYSLEQIERHLRTLNERFPFEVVYVATRDGTLIGWTGVERQTENIGEMGRWHPYVANIYERDEIAESLISEVIKYAKENEMNRLEISFGDISDNTIEAYNKRRMWYKSCRWSLVEDTFYMNKDASEEIQEVDISEGFSIHPLLECDDNALYKCHYASFTTSEAREFYGLSEDEKRQQFNKLYDRTQSINAEASFVLKKGDDIASMLLIISRENEEHISIVAVHPSYRGQGLAKALLTTGIRKVREQGTTNISIGVDVVNTPAVQLYRKFGFEIRSRLSFYSWSRDGS